MDDQQARAAIAGLRRGDPDAWRQLYDALAERLWREVARRLGPHPADVADVVQETMLAAAKSARNYDEAKGSPWQWLWGIARTQVSLHFRNRQRHDRWKQRPTRQPEETEPLETAELAAQVRTALEAIPGDYSELLTAKYSDGESVEGIASRDRTTPTAVRSKLARARAAFRTAFRKIAEPTRT